MEEEEKNKKEVEERLGPREAGLKVKRMSTVGYWGVAPEY